MINRELIRLKVVQLIYAYYQNEGKPLDVAEKEFSFSLSKAYELYEYLLTLLVYIRQFGERKAEAIEATAQRLGSKIAAVQPDRLIAENKFLVKLEENKTLTAYREKKKDWEEEPRLVRNLYKAFTESDVFQLYLVKGEFSFESDRELVRKLYKTFICQNDELDDVLEEHSLYWNDDKVVIDSFVLKTIKRYTSEMTAEQELLPAYSSEDDRRFALDLFRQTITRQEVVRRLIRDNCKNWEFSRLALMDVVIMQIALTEILAFPTIPLNVTFNEYIDIAKVYSTPRSAPYINGLLDHIVKQLKADNIITKS